MVTRIESGQRQLDALEPGDVGVAVVNGTADPGRRRFVLAHELGHHCMADEYTADFGLGTSAEGRESLIDAFAIHFLMPADSVRERWKQLSSSGGDPRLSLVVLAAEYRVSWSAAISHAATLKLIDQNQRALMESRRPTKADYLELGIRFEEELKPTSLAPAYSQAVVRAYRRGVISEGRAVELLRGTLGCEDLPVPDQVPLEALVPDFEDFAP